MAADGQIRIRIGAVQDRSFDTVIGNVERRVRQLKDTATKSLQGASGSGLAKPMQQAAQAADKASRDIERSWNRELAQLNRVAKAQDAIFKKVAADRMRTEEKSARDRVKVEERANKEIERSFRDASRAADREAHQQERAAEQSANRQERARQRFASRVSNRATKFMFPPPIGFIGAGRRIAGDIARGAGIDFSVEGGVQRAVAMQSSTIQLANAERIATGGTRGAKAYDTIARSTGDKYSVGADKVQALMSKFAGITGNYKDLDKIAPQLVSLAVASGSTEFGDVGNAAGMAYNQLKGGPDAIGGMMAVMRGTLGQAAEGAVDPADYAKQMGRIGAGAFKFQGDRSENMLKLSALAQLSMERGATSPADAARSVGSFTNTLGKKARIGAFRKAGVNLFADANQDTYRDPFEIIKDSFRATKGNIPQLSSMFMDVLGRKPIDSLGAVYKGAGGGEAGITAIQKEFDRYMGANLTKGVEQQNNKDYQDSTAAKAAKFQNNLDKIADEMVTKVLPAFEQLEPVVLQLAQWLGGVVNFTAEHPAQAIVLAIVAAIARAGLESALRAALEKAITGSGGGVGAGGVATGGASKVFGMGGVAGGALTAIAPAAAIAGIALAVDQNNKLAQENGGMGIGDLTWGAVKNGSLFTQGMQGMFHVSDDAADEKARAEATARGDKFLRGGPHGALTPEQYDLSMKQAKQEGMFDPVALSRSLTDGLASQTLAVRITNTGELKAAVAVPPPVVPPGGRQPAPGAP